MNSRQERSAKRQRIADMILFVAAALFFILAVAFSEPAGADGCDLCRSDYVVRPANPAIAYPQNRFIGTQEWDYLYGVPNSGLSPRTRRIKIIEPGDLQKAPQYKPALRPVVCAWVDNLLVCYQ